MIVLAYKQGKYKLKFPDKYVADKNDVIYRSSWELKFFIWCETNPKVLRWGSECVVVPYYSRMDGKNRRYYTDCYVEIVDKHGEIKKLLIEIKPYAQTLPPKNNQLKEVYTYQVNQDKWEAANAYAIKHGMEFHIITERELYGT